MVAFLPIGLVLLICIALTAMAILAFVDVLYCDSEFKSKDMFFIPMTDIVSSKAAYVGRKHIAYKDKNIKVTVAQILKANPGTRQLPVWILIVVIVVAGGAGLFGFATHWAYIGSLDDAPVAVNQGYIAYQVVTSVAVLGSMVLMGVRWAPGYRPRVPRARP